MSAFLVDKDHIDYLVTALITYHAVPNGMTADSTGEALWAENAASVAYRYAETPALTAGYRWQAVPRSSITPLQTLKAAQCWRYQTCEHPGHDSSDAWRLIERLIFAEISELPGYSSAQWEWTRAAA